MAPEDAAGPSETTSDECEGLSNLIVGIKPDTESNVQDWQFVADRSTGGVRLERGGFKSVRPLIDYLPHDRPFAERVELAIEWCELLKLDPMGYAERLVLTALGSKELKCWRRWRVAFILASAAMVRVRRGLEAEDPVAGAYAPRIVRIRWHLLRHAFRSPNLREDVDTLLGRGAVEEFRAVRATWVDYLLHYENHPFIAGIDVDQEAVRVVDFDLRSIVETPREGSQLHPYDREERALRSLISREVFARRFNFSQVWRLVESPEDGWTIPAKWSKWLVAICLLLAPLSVSIGLVWSAVAECPPPVGLAWAGLAAGAIAYAILNFSLLFVSERLTYPFMLRFAAGALVGTVFLVSLRPAWLEAAATRSNLLGAVWWQMAAVLLLAAFGYLAVEARLHGSHRWAPLRRAALVEVVGLAHGAVMALGLVLVGAPALEIIEIAEASPAGQYRIAAVAAAGAVAAGVFLQILWEDRPVTYPLGVLRYRRD